MNNITFGKRIAVAALVATMWLLPMAAIAQQTQITAPKNKYPVQTDVTEGNKAAAEIEKQFPIINDRDAAAYIERVGQRLADSIPPQFRHSEFNYRFKWVNASDLNAFALPGGPMYIDRGMIEAAHNEGELAGVMAHELSHVALRHATAQATKASSGKGILAQLPILAGAILGGQAGAQIGAVGTALITTRYSREYESQADTLGAQIMAKAGYDPRDLANVFKTIQQQSKGGAPEWLSSHPDPGNRYEKINREAQYLRISQNPPIKITRDFERTQSKFRAMPPAKSMAQIQKESQGQSTSGPISNGKYSSNVQIPSTRTRTYSGSSWLTLNVPSNWVDLPGQSEITFAPEGAYGQQGITHGVMIGTYKGNSRELARDSQDYVNTVLQGNSYLQQRGGFTRTYVDGRQGNTIALSGQSPVTGKTENVNIYMTQHKTGDLFYAITVVPNAESYNYSSAFRNVLSSIQLND